MIVTCESCQAKYKLDDSKITGRGAKITCPKCRHIFVVYTRQAAPPPSAPVPAPVSSSPPPPPDDDDDGWDDGPTRIGGASLPPPRPLWAAALPVGQHIGMNGVDAAARPNPTLAVSLDEHSDRGVAFLPRPSLASAPSPGEFASRAAALDFKKVGVATWKVKIKLGLIYDFSDIKTLRKYITDGRVTAADVISHDGKNWKLLGDIADLDVFFVETFERLQRARAESAAAELSAPPTPTVSVNLAPPAPPGADAAKRGEEDRRATGESSTFRDPFDELKSKQRERVAARRSAGPAPSEPSGRGGVVFGLLLLLVVVIGGAGAWWYANQVPVTVKPVVTKSSSDKPSETPEEIRKRLNDKIMGGLETVEPPTEVGTSPPMPDGGTLPPGLTPVIPPEAGASSNIPEGAVAVRPRDVRGTQAPTSVGKTGQVKIDSIRSTDYVQIGDASARTGDWSGAVGAYQKAVDIGPSTASLLYKLGSAQYRAGDKEGAYSTLKSAAASGSHDAYKLLGDIAQERGDLSDATAQYTQYLKGNPRDAAQIEKVLKEISGG